VECKGNFVGGNERRRVLGEQNGPKSKKNSSQALFATAVGGRGLKGSFGGKKRGWGRRKKRGNPKKRQTPRATKTNNPGESKTATLGGRKVNPGCKKREKTSLWTPRKGNQPSTKN